MYWRGLSLLLTWVFLSGRKMPISTSVPLSPDSKPFTCSTSFLCEQERGGGRERERAGGETERESARTRACGRARGRAGGCVRAQEKGNERAEA